MSDTTCLIDNGDELLTTAQVAKLTKFATATLTTWRCRQNNGPPFHRHGRFIRYKKSEVLAWLKLAQVTPAYMQLGEPTKTTQPRPWETQRT
jgi:predicted DNA-binding transcriptional regulator AlpA